MIRSEALVGTIGSVVLFLLGVTVRNPVTSPITLGQMQMTGVFVSDTASLEPQLDAGIRQIVWKVDREHFVNGLSTIRNWSKRHPDHLPLFLSLKPQDTAELAALTNDILTVYQRHEIMTPGDIRLAAPSLRAAIRKKGWPELLHQRGRVVFTLHDTGILRDAYLEHHEHDLFFVSAENAEDPQAAWFLVEDPIENLERIHQLVRQGFLVQASSDALADEVFASGAQLITTSTSVPYAATRSNPVTSVENQGGDDLEGPLMQWSLCEGDYDGHLQGIATDGQALYWSHTTRLVKTDIAGKLIHEAIVPDHHGDLTWHDGRVYVAVEFGEFNELPGQTDSWVYVYEDHRFELVEKHPVPELVHGAGGIAYHNGTFVLVGGLPAGKEENVVFAYDRDFRFQAKHALPSGPTRLGIQVAAHVDGHWWFGCYDSPIGLIKVNAAFQIVGTREDNFGYGISGFGADTLLQGGCFDDRHRGRARHRAKSELLMRPR